MIQPSASSLLPTTSQVRVAALIPAAGSGQRLGRGPKAFVDVAGKPLLARAVSAFCHDVDEIVVAVPAELQTEARALLPASVTVIIGGKTRQDTVYKLLQATSAEVVLIHDAARPFLARDIIQRTRDAVIQHGAASVVLRVADSLVEAATGATHDRNALRAVQTPQGFLRALIVQAHEHAQQQHLQVTDDASLVRTIDHEVALVEGSSWLMKVTEPAQLEMAQALASYWDSLTPAELRKTLLEDPVLDDPVK
jgi:2-C-methyl-D-erythritol 4-phosphate cytidylyltransferase